MTDEAHRRFAGRDDEIECEKQTNHGTFYLRKDSILCFKPFDLVKVPQVEDLEEDRKVMLEITNGELVPFMSYVRGTEGLKGPAKSYLRKNLPALVCAYALVADSPIAKFNISAWLYVYRMNIPIKVFRQRRDAIEWLQQYIKR